MAKVPPRKARGKAARFETPTELYCELVKRARSLNLSAKDCSVEETEDMLRALGRSALHPDEWRERDAEDARIIDRAEAALEALIGRANSPKPGWLASVEQDARDLRGRLATTRALMGLIHSEPPQEKRRGRPRGGAMQTFLQSVADRGIALTLDQYAAAAVLAGLVRASDLRPAFKRDQLNGATLAQAQDVVRRHVETDMRRAGLIPQNSGSTP